LSKKDGSKAQHIMKKKMASRMAKLKRSKWYEGAARSVGISKEKPPERRDK
jgi:hypothetical protein